MSEAKKYDRSYKEQPVKLSLETGVKRAVEELNVPYGTLYRWVQTAKNDDLDIEERTPRKPYGITKADREARKSKPKMASYMCRQYLIVMI